MSLLPSRTIALTVGTVDIHWYGIMYALGFLIGMWLLPRLEKRRGLQLTAEQRDTLFLSLFLGVLLGGRLGFVLFYGGSEYWTAPMKILAVWEGGMSSHGGFIGVMIALILFARIQHVSLLALADIIVIPVAIGLVLGRVGNLINGELYGTVTSLPWGLRFPDVDGLRHPTQIYAIIKDLIIAGCCYWHLQSTEGRKASVGSTVALFLMLYAALRFIVEYFREQPYGYVEFYSLRLSEGQLLTLPLFVLGFSLFCIVKARRSV
jgi:phosphatidylglycerol:prolipoprotein diacylglycerol transferase